MSLTGKSNAVASSRSKTENNSPATMPYFRATFGHGPLGLVAKFSKKTRTVYVEQINAGGQVDKKYKAMCWYEIAKVPTRPWHAGAPGLSRPPPPWGHLLESTLGDAHHPFYESEQKL